MASNLAQNAHANARALFHGPLTGIFDLKSKSSPSKISSMLNIYFLLFLSLSLCMLASLGKMLFAPPHKQVIRLMRAASPAFALHLLSCTLLNGVLQRRQSFPRNGLKFQLCSAKPQPKRKAKNSLRHCTRRCSYGLM